MQENEIVAAQSEIFGTIFFLANHLARKTDLAMDSLDVTTKQWLLLAVLLKKFPGQCPTLSEAAHCYGSSRQNVKQIAQQLEARGFLQLVPDPADRRALRLQLTPKISLFDQPEETARQLSLLEGLFEGMSGPELLQLQGLLRHWLQSMVL